MKSLFFLLLLSAPVFAQQQETPGALLPGSYWEKDRAPLKIGEEAPNWALPLAADSPDAKKTEKLELRQFANGKTTIVIFWAFWCDTWKDATVYFGDLKGELAQREVKLVAVAVDASQQPVARPAFAAGKLWFPIAIDQKSETTANYGVRRVPTVFVVAPDGKIKAMWEGLPHKKELLNILEK